LTALNIELGHSSGIDNNSSGCFGEGCEKARADMNRQKIARWVFGTITLCIWVLFALLVIFLVIEIIHEW
jgi:hypothetical protein